MHAVIVTGGKQYRVSPGERLRVERLPLEVGSELAFDKVLLVSDGEQTRVGQPHLEGVQVVAKVTAHGRYAKIRIIKFRRRKHYRKRMGHRQHYTELAIERLVGPDFDVQAPVTEAAAVPADPAPPVAEAPPAHAAATNGGPEDSGVPGPADGSGSDSNPAEDKRDGS